MMSLDKNPYSWKEENITGTVGSLSLTRLNGTVIPVENLPEEIEVISHTSLDTFGYFWFFFQINIFSDISDSSAETWCWAREQYSPWPWQFQHVNDRRTIIRGDTGAENGAIWRYIFYGIPGISKLSQCQELCSQDSNPFREHKWR